MRTRVARSAAMRRGISWMVGVFLVACSGSTTSIGDGSDGGGGVDGSVPDAGGADGATRDASPGGLCPPDTPVQGAECSTSFLSCEYGGTGPELLCSTMATCRGAGGKFSWYVTPPSATCVATQAQNAAACPSSFTGRPTGAACPDATF